MSYLLPVPFAPVFMLHYMHVLTIVFQTQQHSKRVAMELVCVVAQ